MFESIFLPILLGSTALSAVTTYKATQQEKKRFNLEKKRQEVDTRYKRRKLIREAQLQRAAATASAFGSGAFFGSGLAGGLSSLTSQVGEGLGHSTQMSGLARDINKTNQKISNLQGLAALGKLGMDIGYGGGASFEDLLKSSSPSRTISSFKAP